MDIVVLAGGFSDERDVSLSSGSQIANALKKKKHRVILLDLGIGNENHNNFLDAYFHENIEKYSYKVSNNTPDINELRNKHNIKDEIGPNVIPICKSADLVFIALHGGIGENGKLQAIFDSYNIKYTGSGYKSSLLAMDKILSKIIMQINNIQTPKHHVINSAKDIKNISYSFPLVIKPNDNGSSIGVHIVNNNIELQNKLTTSFKYSDTIVIEEYIEGREFSVGVLNKKALPVIELITNTGFYDYYHKYQQGETLEITPAKLSSEITLKIQDIALKLHNDVGLKVYSRTDFIIDKSQNIYCIEINSLPGMTPTSLLPQEAVACGISYEDLCNDIVNLSLKEYI